MGDNKVFWTTISIANKNTSLKNSGYTPLTSNVYLGAWGIKEALDNGADIVVCPRVTDAAVVIGPAAWKYNWDRNQYHFQTWGQLQL